MAKKCGLERRKREEADITKVHSQIRKHCINVVPILDFQATCEVCLGLFSIATVLAVEIKLNTNRQFMGRN